MCAEFACFGVVSTAFKFLLLKFMNAKVIFHLVFPAAHVHHPSKCFFFPRWVFLLFDCFSVGFCFVSTVVYGHDHAGDYGYRGGLLPASGCSCLASGGQWLGTSVKQGYVIGNCFSIFVCATFRGDSCRQKFFATCAPGDKSNADLLCGSFECRILFSKVKYTGKITTYLHFLLIEFQVWVFYIIDMNIIKPYIPFALETSFKYLLN